MMTDAVEAEREWRLSQWDQLRQDGDATDMPAARLRELGVYGGFQGIWVDRQRTTPLTDDGAGATVGVLHTGRHYADDLTDDGVIYHYPVTGRGATRDAGEVAATRNAGRLSLPVFVITQRSHSTRDVRLGWVVDWDDDAKQFLILFGSEPASGYGAVLPPPPGDAEPFHPFDHVHDQQRVMADRQGQERFKFHVLKRYGPKCGVCGMMVGELLQAAHIIPKGEHGSDDPRNGMVLCANHHLAFDAGLFAIEPGSLTLHLKANGPPKQALGLTVEQLSFLRGTPHVDALAWRYAQWRAGHG